MTTLPPFNYSSLKRYLSTLSASEQASFAQSCGTSIGYLRKAISVGNRFDGGLVRRLWVQSKRAVERSDLRPDIWPPSEPTLPPTPTPANPHDDDERRAE